MILILSDPVSVSVQYLYPTSRHLGSVAAHAAATLNYAPIRCHPSSSSPEYSIPRIINYRGVSVA